MPDMRMPVETGDKKGLELDPAPDDTAVDSEGVRRRRRRGMRVPSDDVPRPQLSAHPVTAGDEADRGDGIEDDFDVDVDEEPEDGAPELVTAPDVEVGAPAPGPSETGPDGIPMPMAREASGEIIVDETEPDTDPIDLADTVSVNDPPPDEPAVVLAPEAAAESPSLPAETAETAGEAAAQAQDQGQDQDQAEIAATAEPASSVDDAEELSPLELEEDQSPRPAPPPPPPRAPPPAPSPPPKPSVPPAAVAAALESQPRKRRTKAWFEEVFDEDYLRTLPFLTSQTTQRESAFLLEALALKPGQQVLDVGCGYGRHAMELAARGHSVTAIDLSLPLLLRGADEAQQRGLVINFVHGDMREMTYEAQFDAAYCLFSTFGYFDDDTNKRVAMAIGRSLKPGGRLVLDLLNRDYIVADLPTRIWWEGDGCVVLEEVDFNYYTSRLISNRSIVFEDGRQVEQEISIRAYSLHEVGKLLHGAGFRVLSVSGGLAARGRFFGKDSRQILVVAERRGSGEGGARDGSMPPPAESSNGKP